MKLITSHCVFPVSDICKTAKYYQDKLGFKKVEYLDASEKHICLYRDGVEFILTQSNGKAVIPNHIAYGYGGDAYVIVDDPKSLQDEFKKKGVKIIKSYCKTDYNNKEIVIEDNDGRWIYFGIKISKI